MSLQASGGTSSQDVETVLLQLTMWQGRRGSRKQLLPRYCWACALCCSSIACLTVECSSPTCRAANHLNALAEAFVLMQAAAKSSALRPTSKSESIKEVADVVTALKEMNMVGNQW